LFDWFARRTGFVFGCAGGWFKSWRSTVTSNYQGNDALSRLFGRDQLADGPTPAHDNRSVSDLDHVIHCMRDHHDGRLVISEPCDELEHPRRFAQSKGRRRFIQNDES
jgi:hypothetical protein